MPLFPQFGPEYYDQKYPDVLARYNAFYAESITVNQSFWAEADTDMRFYSNDQTVFSDLYGNLPANFRKQFSFNRIRRVISMIEGHQRRNRKSFVATPVENGDNMTADQYTKIFSWLCSHEDILNTISDSFHGGLVSGMNLMEVSLDFREDPVSGNIKVRNIASNSFIMDPFWSKKDLSDCRMLILRSFFDKRTVLSMLPDYEDQIMGLMGQDNRDGKFQFQPESYNYGMKNLLTYDEFYYRDFRDARFLIDSQTGESMEWKGKTEESEEGLKQFLQLYPTVTVVKQQIPTVRLAIVVQGKVITDGPNPLGIDKYPLVPMVAYYEPSMPYYPYRIQGVVRGLRDSQYLYNRRKVIELDILESQITSGWKYKENALVNPLDVFLQGQGKGLALKEEANMDDVQQIMAPQVPPSMIELSKILGDEISQISGVNEELLGSSNDDKAGILSQLRQGAGLTTLQNLFDNLDQAQELLGRIIVDVIQTNWTPGKVKKILEGEEPQPQFYNKAFGKYHIRVEDGLNTSTQKQMQLAQLLHLREVGIPIPDDVIIDAVTVENKNKLMEAIAQQKQMQQEMQQAQLQAQLGKIQAETELSKARSVADEGLGYERYSRVEENKALATERKAAAIRDEESGFLDLVKALKEIEGMDINHMKEILNLHAQLTNKVEQDQNPNPVKSPRKPKITPEKQPSSSLTPQRG